MVKNVIGTVYCNEKVCGKACVNTLAGQRITSCPVYRQLAETFRELEDGRERTPKDDILDAIFYMKGGTTANLRMDKYEDRVQLNIQVHGNHEGVVSGEVAAKIESLEDEGYKIKDVFSDGQDIKHPLAKV